MKRYTITNQQMGKTWVMECEDLFAFYQNGLPLEYIGADIQEQDITQELEDKKAQQETKRQSIQAKIQVLKSKASDSVKLQTLLDLIFDSDSSLAQDLLRLAAQTKG